MRFLAQATMNFSIILRLAWILLDWAMISKRVQSHREQQYIGSITWKSASELVGCALMLSSLINIVCHDRQVSPRFG